MSHIKLWICILWLTIRPFSFFSFSLECISCYLVGRSDWKKKKKKKKLKKNHNKSRKRRPWYPRMTLEVNIYILGLTKCTIYCKKLFLFFSMLLLCSFFRLKELFQVKNGLTTSLLLVLKMLKIWVGRTTLNGGKKKRGWPNENLNSTISIKRIEPNRNLTSAEADECFMV